MTVIGKMLVFLVLLLAIIWNALVVNAYATRTNWKDQAEKAQAQAAQAAEAANNLRKLIEAEREASEDKARVLREDGARLYEQLQTMKRNYDEVNRAYQGVQNADQQRRDIDNQLQANVNTLQKQVDDLTRILALKEKDVDRLTMESEKSKADATKANIDADVQRRRAEQLAELIQDLQERLREQNAPRGTNPLDRKVQPPTAFRGTVRRREGDLVAITPGADAGLRVGAVLDVQRIAGGSGKYVGKLKIIQVDPKESVGQFTPPAGVRLGPADYPMPGDEVVPD